MTSSQGTLAQNSCPSAPEAKALGLALERPPVLPAAQGSSTAPRGLTPGMERQNVLSRELPLYRMDQLPIKLTTSVSPRARDTLPS